jgi:hypothetical protein
LIKEYHEKHAKDVFAYAIFIHQQNKNKKNKQKQSIRLNAFECHYGGGFLLFEEFHKFLMQQVGLALLTSDHCPQGSLCDESPFCVRASCPTRQALSECHYDPFWQGLL